MSYKTVYSLFICNKYDEYTFNKIVADLEEIGVVGYTLNTDLSANFPDTWYDHEIDMIDLSKKFPDILFCLQGTGEENEDIWEKYFQNGKMQRCYAEIVIPPYDPEKMEELSEMDLL